MQIRTNTHAKSFEYQFAKTNVSQTAGLVGLGFCLSCVMLRCEVVVSGFKFLFVLHVFCSSPVHSTFKPFCSAE